MQNKIRITDSRTIGANEPVFIIAEVGQNHNGDMDIARQLVDAAVDAGADAVKFVKRTIEDVLTREALARPYIGPQSFGDTYGEHRRKLEFSREQHQELADYCHEKGIIYFGTPTDIKAANMFHDIGVPLYKIASRDLINVPLIEHVAQLGSPVLLSTGMSSMQDIEQAVKLISAHTDQLVVLHCTSEYPCDYEHVNLNMIKTLQNRFDIPIGFSGHTIGIVMPVVAAAMGAVVIEKHITIARHMKGTDHAGSLEPYGFKKMVRDIRNLEKAMGDGVKQVYEAELAVKHKLGKSLVAATALEAGTVINKEMLLVKGPGTGISPMDTYEVIGKKLRVAKNEDDILDWGDFE